MALNNLNIKPVYNSSEHDLLNDFYVPCLENSIQYDRAVGYFRSSIFLLVGQPLFEFVSEGGVIRIICSPDLSEEDLNAIINGYDKRFQIISANIEKEINDLLNNEKTYKNAVILATLISIGSLDIRIAFCNPAKGVYHEKLGIFTDELCESVVFRGSSNETYRAWNLFGNFESFDVFCSWLNSNDYDRAAIHKAHFEGLWQNDIQGLDVIPLSRKAIEELKRVAKPSLSDLKICVQSEDTFKRSPFTYQLEAINNWKLNGRRGIIAHATGSGKTFTAICIIKEHIESGIPAIVIVPSRLLLRQWETEIKKEIANIKILLVSGESRTWRKRGMLASYTSPRTVLGKRIIIATMQSFLERH